MTFTKLFSSITESTVWCEDSDTRVVWVTMLAMADKNGRVFGSVPGLAKNAVVSLEACIVALDKFKSPDEWSRTQDYEGRRIEEIDGGWRLLNHGKYRSLRDEEERKAYKAEWIRNKRASVDNVDTSRPQSTYAEADTYTEAGKDKGHSVTDFDRFWSVYPKKVKKKTARDIWKRKRPDADVLIADVENRLVNDGRWLDGFIPDPTTYLNGERWDDDLEEQRNEAHNKRPDSFATVHARVKKRAGLN